MKTPQNKVFKDIETDFSYWDLSRFENINDLSLSRVVCGYVENMLKKKFLNKRCGVIEIMETPDMPGFVMEV